MAQRRKAMLKNPILATDICQMHFAVCITWVTSVQNWVENGERAQVIKNHTNK